MLPSLKLLATLGALLAPRAESLPFSLSRTFGDHMVLQAEPARPVVFGFDTPGSTIQVSVDEEGNIYNTTGADGIWRVALPPYSYGGPHIINVSSSGGGAAGISDVWFGEVFVCGGQSNMQFSVSATLNASAIVADAAAHPSIRLFTVGQGTSSPTPLVDLATVEQPWSIASPASVTDGNDFGVFSALCYLFARELQTTYLAPYNGAVPIGLISANWGGTCLQSWFPPSGGPSACGVSATPALYNALIAPWTVGPTAVQGFLWSQGECNADANTTAYYACAFPAFIEAWRAAFARPGAFFSFQVLPAYIGDSTFSPYSLPAERAAQLRGLAAGGLVHAANTIDLGDAAAPHGSVHPRNKLAVAQRMAAAAAALVYARVVPRRPAYEAPAYVSAAAETVNTTLTVFVNFSATPNSLNYLVMTPAACPAAVPPAECAWFEVQTADGVWRNASTACVHPQGNTVLVLQLSVPAGARANATRGYWSPWPVAVLASAEGLPVLPWWEPVTSANVTVPMLRPAGGGQLAADPTSGICAAPPREA